MSLVLKGRDILNALIELKNPVNLTEIVNYLSANNKGSKTELLEEVTVILEAGVRFGFLMQDENKYSAEYKSAKDVQRHQLVGTEAKNADNKIPTLQEMKNVTSSDELHTSSENVALPKVINNKKSKGTFVSSDDDEDDIHHARDYYSPRFRRSKRSRSRSSGKRRSSRRRKRIG